jgi:hypothetical protein
MPLFTNIDGKQVKIEVGTGVGFKCDIEQYAEVVKIEGTKLTVKAPPDGFSGHYIGRCDFYTLDASETW